MNDEKPTQSGTRKQRHVFKNKKKKDMYWSRQLRYPGTVPASESADFGSQAIVGAAFFHLLVLLCCAASFSFFHLFFFEGGLHVGS